MATLLEDQLLPDAGALGTPQYLPPEQAAPLRRPVDERGDLYSLGVTLYECLAGRLPTQGEGLAAPTGRAVTPLAELRPELPAVLCALVMKLLAPAPDDRYQSAVGLIADLERCQEAWAADGAIASFPLGTRDLGPPLRFASRLYGRAAQLEVIAGALAGASTRGAAEFVLVSGEPGLGKSSLAQELRRMVGDAGGHVIVGRFDEFDRGAPHAPLIQAINDLVRQVLSEAPDRQSVWRSRVQAALGPNAAVLTELCPALEYILRPQRAAPELPPRESENRFLAVVQGFFRAVCHKRSPLVLFLDDLQWGDAATLDLLAALVTDASISHLLVVGTTRNAAVEYDHALHQTMTVLSHSAVPIYDVELTPLAVADIRAMLADAFADALDELDALAEFVAARTGGNPLFVRVFVRELHDKGVITRDAGRWRWDRRHADLTSAAGDDASALLVGLYEGLGAGGRAALEVAACIGRAFELSLLAAALDRPIVEVATDLHAAVERWLIRARVDSLPLLATLDVAEAERRESSRPDVQFEFLHDRLRQDIYTRLSADARRRWHRAIGERLLAQHAPAELSEIAFTLVHHLNIARPLLTAPAEQLALARYNLTAGERAKRAASYEASIAYLDQGVALLPASAWERAELYPLALALHRTLLESLYLKGDLERVLELFPPLLERVRPDCDRAELIILRVILDTGRGRYAEAAEIGLAGLAELGVALPGRSSRAALLAEHARARLQLGGGDLKRLSELPEATDERKLLAQRLLVAVYPALAFTRGELMELAALRLVSSALEDGLSEVSAYGFACYGMVLALRFHTYERAAAHAALAHDLNERFDNQLLVPKLALLGGFFVESWVTPFSLVRAKLRRGVDVAKQVGDLQYLCYNGGALVTLALLEGQELSRVLDKAEGLLHVTHEANEINEAGILSVVIRLCVTLATDSASVFRAVSEDWLKDARVGAFTAENAPTAVRYCELFKLMVRYLLGQHDQAAKHADALRDDLGPFRNVPAHVDLLLFDALNTAARASAMPFRRRQRALLRLGGIRRKLQALAERCPQNFDARHHLVAAELARVRGRHGEALTRYNEAIEAARKSGALHCEALALELSSRLSLDRGDRVVALVYLREALAAYRRWGALAKVERLTRTLGELGRAEDEARSPGGRRSISSPLDTTTSPGSLDVYTLFEAAKGLALEVELDGLLRAFLKIAMDYAGAERGVVVLQTRRRLTVEAAGRVEPGEVEVFSSIPLEQYERAPIELIKSVARAHSELNLEQACRIGTWTRDPYIREQRVHSVLCAPITSASGLVGVLYLESRTVAGAFGGPRVALLRQLNGLAAVYIEARRRARRQARALAQARARAGAVHQLLVGMSKGSDAALAAVIEAVEEVERATEGVDVSAALRQRVDEVTSAAAALMDVTAAVREYTELAVRERAREEIDLDALSQELARELQPSFAALGGALDRVERTLRTTICGDRRLVRNIARLMLQLALQFNEGGRVSLRAARVNEDRIQWVRLTTRDSDTALDSAALASLVAPRLVADELSSHAAVAALRLALLRNYLHLVGGDLHELTLDDDALVMTAQLRVHPLPAALDDV
ncbi:MAG: AAA family ATPase [Nannocystaceae bacterium]